MHKSSDRIQGRPGNPTVTSSRLRREEAFTLIELLVVILIIGILAAIAFLVFGAQQAEALKASVKADVRNTVGNITQSLVKDPTADPISAAPVVTQGNNVDIEGSWNDYAVYGSSEGLEGWTYAYFANKDGVLSQAAEAGTPAYGQWREITSGSSGGGGEEDGGDAVVKDEFVTFAHQYYMDCAPGTVTVTVTSSDGPVAAMVENWNIGTRTWVYEADGSFTVDMPNPSGDLGGYVWAMAETAPNISYSGAACTDVGAMFGSPANDGAQLTKSGNPFQWSSRFPDWATAG